MRPDQRERDRDIQFHARVLPFDIIDMQGPGLDDERPELERAFVDLPNGDWMEVHLLPEDFVIDFPED